MKKANNLYLGINETEKVDAFFETFEHPLRDLVLQLRKIILKSSNQIGEGIYWNAPTFFYTGKLGDFDPKKYKRYIIGFVFNKQDCIRMVILKGDKLADTEGLLSGDYKDGRRLIVFNSIEEIKLKKRSVENIIMQLIEQIKMGD